MLTSASFRAVLAACSPASDNFSAESLDDLLEELLEDSPEDLSVADPLSSPSAQGLSVNFGRRLSGITMRDYYRYSFELR